MRFYKRLSFWFFLFIGLLIFFLIVKQSFKYIEVKALPAKRQELVITVTATSTGTIKSDRDMKVTAQRIGRISKLYVGEGDTVKPGSMIAELDPDEAALNLRIAQASFDKAQAVLNEAGGRLKRLDELREKGYVSQVDFDVMQREYDVASASLKEAKNSLSLSKLNYDYSFIRSPVNGVITSRPVKNGETVSKGSLIANIVSLEDLYIESFIDEADVAKVRLGQEADITMDAYQGRVFKGEVYMISPVVLGGKQETRTFEVRTQFKEKGIVIKPGMSADVEIVVDHVKDALVVPSQAIIEKEGRKFVYIEKDSYARFFPVKVGRFNWSFTEIVSGIKEGDRVIVNPDVPGLADGKRVREAKI